MPKKILGVDEFSENIFSPSKGERDYDGTVFFTIQNLTNRSEWLKNRINEINQDIGELLATTKIFAETGAPAPTLGNDGDLYIDTDTSVFYYKSSSTWTSVLDSTAFGHIDTINSVDPISKNVDIKVGAGLEIDNISQPGTITINLYVTPVAALSGGSTNEIGVTISSVNLSWTYNKTEISQSLNQAIGAITVGQRAYNDSPSLTTDTTYTLSINDGTTGVTSNTSVLFRNKSHWGTSANTTLTTGQILGLANEAFDTNRNTSFTLDGNGEYLYYAYPSSYGVATFTVNGLLNTAWTLSVVSHTNASGHTENYNVYRSNTIQNGTGISVGVS
jgi:hypothetical protein